MKTKLNNFFQMHPVPNSMETAIDMIIKKLECAEMALEAEDPNADIEAMYYVAEVYKMIESLLSETGKNPQQLLQTYPQGFPGSEYSKGYDKKRYPQNRQDYPNPNNPNPRPNDPGDHWRPGTYPPGIYPIYPFPPGYR